MLLNVAAPAADPSIVKNVVSTPPSVPLKIISESLAAASIVILPDEVVSRIAASPIVKSSAAVVEPMYVLTLDIATFLFVPPAPSSTINKSASTKAAPISVAPSISKDVIAAAPVGNVTVLDTVNVGVTIVLPARAVNVFAVNLKSSAPAILISIWSSVLA
jgi:hypothetical protein